VVRLSQKGWTNPIVLFLPYSSQQILLIERFQFTENVNKYFIIPILCTFKRELLLRKFLISDVCLVMFFGFTVFFLKGKFWIRMAFTKAHIHPIKNR